jgi:exodeoxyribonuclease V alpha subunit
VAPEAVAFEGVEHVDASFSTVADVFLERWWRTQVAASPDFERRSSRLYAEREGVVDAADREDLRALIDVHARSRILCATRLQGFPACAVAINEQLVARLGAEGSRGARRARLPSGTPVLVQRNDYERRLYNGDQGVVVRMDRGRGHGAELVAVFARGGGAFDVWPADEIPDLAPAFAMTVHKAQGSELDHVALVLPDADLPLLTRELVYTAVTRARRSVVLLGKSDLLARAVSRTVERHSGIAELLVSR